MPMAIPLNYGFKHYYILLVLHLHTSKNVSVPETTFRILDIGFNLLPFNSRMSNMYSQIRYFTGEFQTLQLIVRVVLGVMVHGLTTCLQYVSSLFGYLALNNSWFVRLTFHIDNFHCFCLFIVFAFLYLHIFTYLVIYKYLDLFCLILTSSSRVLFLPSTLCPLLR